MLRAVSTVRYAAGRAALSSLSMLSSIAIYRLLGPSETGAVVLLLGISQALAPVLGFGTGFALTKFVVSAGPRRSRRLYRRAMIALSVGAALFAGATAGPWLPAAVPRELRDNADLVVVVVAALGWQNVNDFMLRGLGRLNTTTIGDAISDILPRLAVVPLLVAGVGNYVSYLVLQAAVAACVSVTTTLVILHRLRRLADPARESQPGGYGSFALNMVFSWIAWAASVNVGFWLIRYLVGPHEVGVFAVAMRIPLVVMSLMLTPLLAPLIYFGTIDLVAGERGWRRARAGTAYLGVALGCVSLIMTGTAPIAIAVLFGDAYAGALQSYRILAQLPFVSALQVFMSAAVIVSNRIYLNNLALALGTIAQLIGGMILVPTFGASGIASVLVGSYFLLSVLAMGYFTRDVLPGLGPLVLRLAAIYISAAGIALTPAWPIAVVGFLVSVFALRVLRWEDALADIRMVVAQLGSAKERVAVSKVD